MSLHELLLFMELNPLKGKQESPVCKYPTLHFMLFVSGRHKRLLSEGKIHVDGYH